MSKLSSCRKKKQTQLLRRAIFGKSAPMRMQALLLLMQSETIEGGWLLETALKYQRLSVKDEVIF